MDHESLKRVGQSAASEARSLGQGRMLMVTAIESTMSPDEDRTWFQQRIMKPLRTAFDLCSGTWALKQVNQLYRQLRDQRRSNLRREQMIEGLRRDHDHLSSLVSSLTAESIMNLIDSAHRRMSVIEMETRAIESHLGLTRRYPQADIALALTANGKLAYSLAERRARARPEQSQSKRRGKVK